MLLADDAEMYERKQRGVAAVAPEWLDLTRGLHRERVDRDGFTIGEARLADAFALEEWEALWTDDAVAESRRRENRGSPRTPRHGIMGGGAERRRAGSCTQTCWPSAWSS